MPLEIVKQFDLDATPDRVWEVMIGEFLDVDEWVSGVQTTRPHPEVGAFDDGTPAGRVCRVDGFGLTDERITFYRPETREFAYSVEAEKVPSFMSGLSNHWTVSRAGSGARVKMHVRADVSGPLGKVMTPLMRRRFETFLDSIEEDLRVYVEKGRVSNRKARELAARRTAA